MSIRIRQLPDGRYVTVEDNGDIVSRQKDGTIIESLVPGSIQYKLWGLSEYNKQHVALYNYMDPTTKSDPYVLVWNGALRRYLTRAESDKYNAVNTDPSGVVIGPDE